MIKIAIVPHRTPFMSQRQLKRLQQDISIINKTSSLIKQKPFHLKCSDIQIIILFLRLAALSALSVLVFMPLAPPSSTAAFRLMVLRLLGNALALSFADFALLALLPRLVALALLAPPSLPVLVCREDVVLCFTSGLCCSAAWLDGTELCLLAFLEAFARSTLDRDAVDPSAGEESVKSKIARSSLSSVFVDLESEVVDGSLESCCTLCDKGTDICSVRRECSSASTPAGSVAAFSSRITPGAFASLSEAISEEPVRDDLFLTGPDPAMSADIAFDAADEFNLGCSETGGLR
jgi:hypothetical protein